jgi:3-oxoadipate enol-lactonase
MTAVLAHRVDGAGAPVLLLNGGMMSLSAWQEIATPLAERYQIVRCDFRGQLTSPGAPHPTLGGHVDDVLSLLDQLGISLAHVVGTSFGAEVGLLLAATHPERVASLVAVTATDVETPVLKEGGALLCGQLQAAARGGDRRRLYDSIVSIFYSLNWASAHRTELDARREQLTLLPAEWFENAAGILASLAGLDLRAQLGSIACPTLVVAAEGDIVMPLAYARALAAAIPGARLEVVVDSGHVLVQEQPGRLLDLLLRFLAEVADA